MIEANKLSKQYKVLDSRGGIWGAIKDLFTGRYKTVPAVNEISFEIPQGSLVGFLGPNGAGKSTTIKMMVGALSPSAGSITVNGNDPFKERRRFVKDIGIVFGQRSQLWWDIPVRESFDVLQKIYEIPYPAYKKKMEYYNNFPTFRNIVNVPVRKLSLGQRTLADILAAFLHSPKVVFLDEPTIGLDLVIKEQVRDLLLDLNSENETTVILTSHDISDVDALCQRIIMIDKGTILFDGSKKQFGDIHGKHKKTTFTFSHENIAERFKKDPGVVFNSRNVEIKNVGPRSVEVIYEEGVVPLIAMIDSVLGSYEVDDLATASFSLEDTVKLLYKRSGSE